MEGEVMVEAEVQDRSGRWHRLQVRPRRTAEGRADGTILSLVDIDALRHEVVRAEWARDYARSIVEAVQVPLVVLDVGGHVLSANAAYHALFQETSAQTDGRGFFELGAGEWDAPELRRAVSDVSGLGGRFQALELARSFPGAGRRTVSVSGCAVPAPGSDALILLAVEDVTARRQGDDRRAELLAVAEEAKERAELAGRAKDVFLANLSHELRTPLTSILLHAETLQGSRLDAQGVKRAGASIEAGARRQVRLVEDLLDVSRIVAGKLSLSLVEVDLRALVLAIVERLTPEAEARSVVLAAEGLTDSSCMGDPARLQQVVANLVGNALKFTPAGGKVRVRLDAPAGQARLVVADTGKGIDPSFLPRVFERFAQEDPTDRRHDPGLGLGLSIAHTLVALHGGALRAESPGRDLGATFTVTLPRLDAAPVA
jgi:two-component system CheB/CheR fusion protein